MIAVVRIAVLSFLATLAPLPARATTLPYSNLIIFGDSLTDAGNEGPPMADGGTWATLLGTLPYDGLGGTNFARRGGYAVDRRWSYTDFKEQKRYVGTLASGYDAKTLTIVWLGVNDLFAGVPPADVVSGLALEIMGLTGSLPILGRLVLAGVPDLGALPILRGNPNASRYTEASNAFNAALRDYVQTGPSVGLELHFADIAGLFAEVQFDPGAYGFTNTTGHCNQGDTAACAGYMFWDSVHPTTAMHALIANRMIGRDGLSAPVPLPGAAWLMIAALGGLAALRRRSNHQRGS